MSHTFIAHALALKHGSPASRYYAICPCYCAVSY